MDQYRCQFPCNSMAWHLSLLLWEAYSWLGYSVFTFCLSSCSLISSFTSFSNLIIFNFWSFYLCFFFLLSFGLHFYSFSLIFEKRAAQKEWFEWGSQANSGLTMLRCVPLRPDRHLDPSHFHVLCWAIMIFINLIHKILNSDYLPPFRSKKSWEPAYLCSYFLILDFVFSQHDILSLYMPN